MKFCQRIEAVLNEASPLALTQLHVRQNETEDDVRQNRRLLHGGRTGRTHARTEALRQRLDTECRSSSYDLVSLCHSIVYEHDGQPSGGP